MPDNCDADELARHDISKLAFSIHHFSAQYFRASLSQNKHVKAKISIFQLYLVLESTLNVIEAI